MTSYESNLTKSYLFELMSFQTQNNIDEVLVNAQCITKQEDMFANKELNCKPKVFKLVYQIFHTVNNNVIF